MSSRTRSSIGMMALLCIMAPSSLHAQSMATPADTIARGRTIFLTTCRRCHTVGPPPQAAPPMALIAQRYVTATGSRAAARARIAEWLAGPTVEKSILPRAEVARFGVMPHQPLADAGRFSVAAYVMTLADSTTRAGRRRSK